MQTLIALHRATLAARERTGDKTIGTSVNAGRFNVVRVTYNARGNSIVTVLAGNLTAQEAIDALGSL